MAKKKGTIKLGLKPIKGLIDYTASEGYIFITRKYKNCDDLLLPTGQQWLETKEYTGRIELASQYLEDGKDNKQVLAFKKVGTPTATLGSGDIFKDLGVEKPKKKKETSHGDG